MRSRASSFTEGLAEWSAFIAAESVWLEDRPWLLWQQAANQPPGSRVARAAERDRSMGRGPRGPRRPWLRWLNSSGLHTPRLLTRELHYCRAVAASADGSRIAAAGDRRIAVWETATGRALASWSLWRALDAGPEPDRLPAGDVALAHTPRSSVVALGLGEGGRVLAAVGSRPGDHFGKPPVAWFLSVETKEVLTGIEGPSHFEISPDGRSLVTVDGRTVEAWSVDAAERRFLWREEARVSGVAFSPGGRCLAVEDVQGGLTVRDLDTGDVLGAVAGGLDGSLSALSRTGRFAVVRDPDHGLLLWDLDVPRRVCRLEGHTEANLRVAVTADGERIVSTSRDGTMRIWDVRAGREVFTSDDRLNRRHLVLTEDDRHAVTSRGHHLEIFDVDRGRRLGALKGHSRVEALALVSGGNRLLAGDEGFVCLWSLDDILAGENRFAHDSTVRAVAVDGAGRSIVSGAADGTLAVWDRTGGAPRVTPIAGTEGVSSIAVSGDGRRALIGRVDGALELLDLDRGAGIRPLGRHEGRVGVVALSDDGGLAVSAGWDGTVRLWNLAAETGPLELDSGLEYPQVLSFGAGGRYLAVKGTEVRVWDLETGTRLLSRAGFGSEARALAWTPDGRSVVVPRPSHDIVVLDVRSGSERVWYNPIMVMALAVSADGTEVVTGDLSGDLRVWSLETGKVRARLGRHAGTVHAIAATGDDRMVSVGDDGTLRVWDIGPGAEVTILPGIAAMPRLATAGTTIAAGGSDGAVYILDLVSGIRG